MFEKYGPMARPEARPFLTGLLDSACDMASLYYHFATYLPYSYELDEDGFPVRDRIADLEDEARNELVLYSYGRSMVEDKTDYSPLGSLAWAEFAQASIRRVARQRHIQAMWQLAGADTFTNPGSQIDAYDSMAEKLTVLNGPPIENSSRLECAVRIALREIGVVSDRSDGL